MFLGCCADAKMCVVVFPAVSEVSSSLQAGMVLFSYGEQEEKVNIYSLRAQSLDVLLDRSPKHPPSYTLRKGFNGEALHAVCTEAQLSCCNVFVFHVSLRFGCHTFISLPARVNSKVTKSSHCHWSSNEIQSA